LSASALCLAWAASCGVAERGVTRGVLRVAGSDAALPLLRAEADTFRVSYGKARIDVEGGGSLLGLEALINKEADVAVLSRAPTDEEKEVARKAGVPIAIYPFAHDGLAVIVHRANPVYALSFREAKAVFAGEATDWSEVGGGAGRILVYTSGVASGALGYARRELLDGGEFAPGAGRAPSTRGVVDSVAAHEDAIGFAGMAEVDERVKALPISPKGGGALTVLDMESVHNRSYPLVRTFYFATRGIPRDDLVSGFVSFVMSTRGQKIVLDHGFVPATVPLHIKRAE
jgi:phosphate transport system substrate-binding protein